jgi:hypothetical protein
MSRTFPDVIRFEIKHPTVSPGIAAAVKQGKTHSASESLSCIAPEESPKTDEMSVRTT